MIKREIKFFLNIEPQPPTVTHQEKRVAIRNGIPVFYEDARLKEARKMLESRLLPFIPEKKWDCPIRLWTQWWFSCNGRNKRLLKTTKPDTDNLQKMLKDCMTRVGFWKDDSLVCWEITQKLQLPENAKHGIYIRIADITDENPSLGPEFCNREIR